MDSTIPLTEKQEIRLIREIILNSYKVGLSEVKREYHEKHGISHKPPRTTQGHIDHRKIDLHLAHQNLEFAYENLNQGRGIATLPLLIAAKANQYEIEGKYSTYFNSNGFFVLSEELAGINPENGEKTIAIVHGGGVITPEVIYQSLETGLTKHFTLPLSKEKFNEVLTGKLPSGEEIEVYSVQNIIEGIPNPFGRYVVHLPFSMNYNSENKMQTGEEFVKDPLTIARAGTTKYLDEFFKGSIGLFSTEPNVKRTHPSRQEDLGREVNWKQPSGSFLYSPWSTDCFSGIQFSLKDLKFLKFSRTIEEILYN